MANPMYEYAPTTSDISITARLLWWLFALFGIKLLPVDRYFRKFVEVVKTKSVAKRLLLSYPGKTLERVRRLTLSN